MAQYKPSKAIASCSPQLLHAPHQSYNIPQLPLLEMEKGKIIVTVSFGNGGGDKCRWWKKRLSGSILR